MDEVYALYGSHHITVAEEQLEGMFSPCLLISLEDNNDLCSSLP